MGKKRLKVVVIYKKSAYQIYVQEHHNSRIEELLEQKSVAVRTMWMSHQENESALTRVREVLHQRRLRARFLYRASVQSAGDADLVISVGGDGTLLEAARHIMNGSPLLGVNSSPSTSTGYLCAAREDNFEEVLELFFEGRLRRHRLTRIQVEIDGQPLLPLALNDVLFTNSIPAATSRYLMRLGQRQEKDLLPNALPNVGDTILPRADPIESPHRERPETANAERIASPHAKDNASLSTSTEAENKPPLCQKIEPIWEEQKSSGVWIATATGSTAAIQCAGGKVMPLGSRRLQYLVREPYEEPHCCYQLKRGFLQPEQALLFIPKMRQGFFYLDGHRIKYPVDYGQQLAIYKADQPLHLLGDLPQRSTC